MHSAFARIEEYGTGSRRVFFLHGSGGPGSGVPEKIAQALGVTVVFPVAASGKAWLTKSQMARLVLTGGPIKNIAAGIAWLVEQKIAEPIFLGWSQGGVVLLETIATRPDIPIRVAAVTCSTLVGIYTPWRYSKFAQRETPVKIFMTGHQGDPKVPYFMASKTQKFLAKQRTASVTAHFDVGETHSPYFDFRAIETFLL